MVPKRASVKLRPAAIRSQQRGTVWALLAMVSLLAQCGVVFAQTPPLHVRLDEVVAQGHVGPLAPAAGDAEFARRAYLDLTGMVPSSAELAAFASDAAPDKRTKLVD